MFFLLRERCFSSRAQNHNIRNLKILSIEKKITVFGVGKTFFDDLFFQNMVFSNQESNAAKIFSDFLRKFWDPEVDMCRKIAPYEKFFYRMKTPENSWDMFFRHFSSNLTQEIKFGQKFAKKC